MKIADIETVEPNYSGLYIVTMYINGTEFLKEEIEEITSIPWHVIQRRISRSHMTPFNALTKPYKKLAKTTMHWEHPAEELARNRVACMPWK